VVNFVARNGEEITRAREELVAGRFPEVYGYPDPARRAAAARHPAETR